MPRNRWFSIRPGITMRGRTFKGLRGWAGKPSHPPLAVLTAGAYTLAAAFDVISLIWSSHDAFVAATWAFIGGAVVSPFTALTGFSDWWESTPKYTQAWRTTNWHMALMVTVTVLVVVDVVWRLGQDGPATLGLGLLSVAIGGLTVLGGTYGGSLTYDYGFNVETSGDHPVWHRSEEDVFPGDHPESLPASTGE